MMSEEARRLAVAAGFDLVLLGPKLSDCIERLIQVAKDEENEACAKLCHATAVDQRRHALTRDGALMCRDAIRARRKP